jgi:hypothetical protein
MVATVLLMVPSFTELDGAEGFQDLALTPALNKLSEGLRDSLLLRTELPDATGVFQQNIVDYQIRRHTNFPL